MGDIVYVIGDSLFDRYIYKCELYPDADVPNKKVGWRKVIKYRGFGLSGAVYVKNENLFIDRDVANMAIDERINKEIDILKKKIEALENMPPIFLPMD